MAPHSPTLTDSDSDEHNHPLKPSTTRDAYGSTLSLAGHGGGELSSDQHQEDEVAGLLRKTKNGSTEEDDDDDDLNVYGQSALRSDSGHVPIRRGSAGASPRLGATSPRLGLWGSLTGQGMAKQDRRAFFTEMVTQVCITLKPDGWSCVSADETSIRCRRSPS